MQPNTTQVQVQDFPDILTESEAAKMLRCSWRTLQRARLAGKTNIPFVFVGERAMYSKAAILRAFEGSLGVQP